MSTYQNYEFQVSDRCLTEEEMSELRPFSSRADFTSCNYSFFFALFYFTLFTSISAFTNCQASLVSYLNPNTITNKAYELWFSGNKGIIDELKKRDFQSLSVIQGMILLEPHAIIRAGWYSTSKYAGDPKSYGFEMFKSQLRKRPVLLLHGAVGSWNYLGDLATKLNQAGIPVFVINLGAGGPTENRRQQIWDKIDQIRALYLYVYNEELPQVDIVAHSMGANLAYAALFDANCSFINSEGCLQFYADCTAHPAVGTVITIANPLEKVEVEKLQRINKIDSFFNIIAKFDAIMGHKQPGFIGDLAHHAEEVDAGHIGIVFNEKAHKIIVNRLNS